MSSIDAMALELADRLNRLELGRFEADLSSVRLIGSDYHVNIHIVGAGRGRPYEVERALSRIDDSGDYVVVAEGYTPGALRILDDAGANYMDSLRLRLRLSTPQFFVHIVDGSEVSGAGSVDQASTSLAGAAGAVVISILEHHSEDIRVTELARSSGVAPGTAQKVVFALEAEGLLRPHGRGPHKIRRVTDPAELLDRYAAAAAADRRLPLRCRILHDDAFDVARMACEGLRQSNVKCCVTGAVAAAVDAPAITEVPVAELWVHGPRSQDYLLRAVDGIQAERGANLILWRSTTRGPMAGSSVASRKIRLTLASPYRVYADLLANPQRGREQAEVYRESVIGL